jgi:hypothetical protein
MERTGDLPPALLRFSAQPVSHALLVSIGIQVATLVFFPAAAPADIVTAQAIFLVGLFLITEKAFNNFHIYLYPISLAMIDCHGHSAFRIPQSS